MGTQVSACSKMAFNQIIFFLLSYKCKYNQKSLLTYGLKINALLRTISSLSILLPVYTNTFKMIYK